MVGMILNVSKVPLLILELLYFVKHPFKLMKFLFQYSKYILALPFANLIAIWTMTTELFECLLRQKLQKTDVKKRHQSFDITCQISVYLAS